MTLVNTSAGAKKWSRRIDTGVHLVTPDNMNDPEIKELLSPPLRPAIPN